MNTTQRNNARRGYTLVELLVATASATVLFAGLASSVYVASQSLRFGEGALIAEGRDSRALDRLLADTREALRFTEATTTAITFDVPDRTGDGLPDTIRYAWSGLQGDPLTYEFNGSTPASVVEDVQQLDFGLVTRQLDRGEDSEAADAATVYYQGISRTTTDSEVESIPIDTPNDVLEDHLLIAAVALDGSHSTSLAPPAGWTQLLLDDFSGDITFGVWWKLAVASEPSSHTFTWSGSECAYGWIMHFTGHDLVNPIHATEPNSDDFRFPLAKAVTTTVNNCLVLRLGAFNEDDITDNDTGIVDHRYITMKSRGTSGSQAVSGGAAYAIQGTAGDTGYAEFELNSKREYLTLTVAIAPAAN